MLYNMQHLLKCGRRKKVALGFRARRIPHVETGQNNFIVTYPSVSMSVTLHSWNFYMFESYSVERSA